MKDKVCVVTGATSGLGEASAQALAARGAKLYLIARNPTKATATRDAIHRATGNGQIELVQADLESQSEIRAAAEQIAKSEARIDVLLNNAGVTLLRRETTSEGFEKTFAVNHLAYFLLTNLLLDRLRAAPAARVVNVASDAHKFGGALDFSDLGLERGYSWVKAYGRSKGANILFTRELARRLEGSSATANSLHPGFVRSGLGSNNGGLGALIVKVAGLFAQSPERGASTSVHLCCEPELANTSGDYFARCRPHSAASWATDDASARRLWTISEEWTGLTATAH